MGKYKSKFNGQQIDDGIEYGVRVTQQTFSSEQKQQARGNIAAQETLVVGTNLDDTPTANSTNPVTSRGVKTALDGKAEKDGNYPELVAGNIVGSFNNESYCSFRPTADNNDINSDSNITPSASLKRIQGNYINWIQLYDNSVPAAVSGHTYYIRENNNGTIARSVGTTIAFTEGSTERNVIDLTVIYGTGTVPSSPDAFEKDYFDWFGKPLGYEPYDAGSIKLVKFTGIKTVGFNQYGGGSLKVISGQQYQITGTYTSIAINGETVTPESDGTFTPSASGTLTVTGGASDTCIHFVHSGKRNGETEAYWESMLNVHITALTGKLNGEGSSVTVFPDGMMRTGDVRDEIVVKGKKTVAIKRIGVTNLATSSWSGSNGTWTCQAYNYNEDFKKGVQRFVFSGLKDAGGGQTGSGMASQPDLSIGTGGTNNRGIYIKDSSCANYAAARSKYSGKPIYYILATPKEYVLDDFELPQSYYADDFGTEEIISESNYDCPRPLLTVEYGVNAPDAIRNLPVNYVSVKEEQEFTEAQKARARKNIGLDSAARCIVSKVSVSTDLSDVTCSSSITGSDNSGMTETVIYENSGTTDDYTISVLSSYKTPDGSQLTITCPADGYCEINYLNVDGVIYARGI